MMVRLDWGWIRIREEQTKMKSKLVEDGKARKSG
jgi:hypothetical protein